MNKFFLSLLLTAALNVSFASNPFLIEAEKKETLTHKDWVDIQQNLRKIDVATPLDQLYPESHKNAKKPWFRKLELKQQGDFLGRISRGVKQTLINESEDKMPLKELIQINNGGESCIVSFASYDGLYVSQMRSIIKELEKTGWNGNFLLMAGGYPNPTGEELQYAGVPYAFKIFALLEAKKLGFQKALWIDAAMQPLKSPEAIFDEIEKNGCFFQMRKNAKRYLLPATQKVLLSATGIDMYETKSVRARIIGLNFAYPSTQALVDSYYEMVKLGTPFISCFPEEHVLGALVAKQKENFPPTSMEKVVKNQRKLHGKSEKWAEENQYFFLLRKH